jgi:hypothetical protein
LVTIILKTERFVKEKIVSRIVSDVSSGGPVIKDAPKGMPVLLKIPGEIL